jgi:hypothetical protein
LLLFPIETADFFRLMAIFASQRRECQRAEVSRYAQIETKIADYTQANPKESAYIPTNRKRR